MDRRVVPPNNGEVPVFMVFRKAEEVQGFWGKIQMYAVEQVFLARATQVSMALAVMG